MPVPSGQPSERSASRRLSTEDDDDEPDVEDPTTDLSHATKQFMDEHQSMRALQMEPGSNQLSADAFVEYLGIDLQLEPELVWIAREMAGAPMPPNAEAIVSKSRLVYFHDLENDYFTMEHPLTQRYLKVLEKERLDLLALRSKPSVNMLIFRQPEMTFHSQFKNLQIPCQLCNVMQSTVKCHQCIMSFCQSCFDSLHSNCEGPRKDHTTIPTAVGSLCSSCNKKKPQVYCANCGDYFCFRDFELMHSKGNRMEHKAMCVTVSDGEVIESQKKCEECNDNPAAFYCDYCRDNFCMQCFWKCHFNGFRRNHTVSKVSINPLCNQCNRTRATVFCEQCQELHCTDCFTFLHYKGNRQLHLFSDATNLLLLLERMDPTYQEHMRRARPRVLWAITQLQGWTRGIEARQHYRRERDLVTKIQRRWRGAMTRRKLLNMLDQYKWRRKQVNDFFLPKTRQERTMIKQRFQAQYFTKDTTHESVKRTLRNLKQTVLDTKEANPLEDITRTTHAMQQDEPAVAFRTQGLADTTAIVLPGQGAGTTLGSDGLRTKLGQSSLPALSLGEASKTGGSQTNQNLTTTDLRQGRDATLRQQLELGESRQGQ